MTDEKIKEYTRRISQENTSGLMLVLCDMTVTYMEDALIAYQEKDAASYDGNIEYARRSINELIGYLNPKQQLSYRVIKLLRYNYGLLNKAAISRNPVDIDRSICMFARYRNAFEALHKVDNSQPAMGNTHQVYAGLTYGRGTLTESIDSSNYENRGFKA